MGGWKGEIYVYMVKWDKVEQEGKNVRKNV